MTDEISSDESSTDAESILSIDLDDTLEGSEVKELPKNVEDNAQNSAYLQPAEFTHRKRHKSEKKIAELLKNRTYASVPWGNLGLCRIIVKRLLELGFSFPTVTQARAIPPALEGHDLLVTAQTGSGKTASFLLPIIEKLFHCPHVRSRKKSASGVTGGNRSIRVLILLPTRELAVQCRDMLSDLVGDLPVLYLLVTGGMVDQSNQLANKPDIILATPGRILDLLLNSRSIHVEDLEIVVLDEADRLMELGFKNECLAVLKHCRGLKVQRLLYSATLNTAVSEFSDLCLKNPVCVNTQSVETVNEMVNQVFCQIPSEQFREAAVLSLAMKNLNRRALIFFQTKKQAHRMSIIFQAAGLPSSELHGNMSQTNRASAIEDFANGRSTFLIATELASRGLDIPDLDHVINSTLPFDMTRYIHRCGRVGRMGTPGTATTIFTVEERLLAKKLNRLISSLGREKKEVVPNQFKHSTVSSEDLKKNAELIQSLESLIKTKLHQEFHEREMRLAEQEIRKSENLQKYMDEIMVRPVRKWITTKKEKKEINKKSKSRAMYKY